MGANRSTVAGVPTRRVSEQTGRSSHLSPAPRPSSVRGGPPLYSRSTATTTGGPTSLRCRHTAHSFRRLPRRSSSSARERSGLVRRAHLRSRFPCRPSRARAGSTTRTPTTCARVRDSATQRLATGSAREPPACVAPALCARGPLLRPPGSGGGHGKRRAHPHPPRERCGSPVRVPGAPWYRRASCARRRRRTRGWRRHSPRAWTRPVRAAADAALAASRLSSG